MLGGGWLGTVEDGDPVAMRLTSALRGGGRAHSRIWRGSNSRNSQLPHIRIFRSYQSLYLHKSGPPSACDIARGAELHPDLRASRSPALSRGTSAKPGTPKARAGRLQPDDRGREAIISHGWRSGCRTQSGAADCLHRYEETDRAVFHWLQPFEENLWTVAGLGREPEREENLLPYERNRNNTRELHTDHHDLPAKFRREGCPALIPLYYLLRLSDLAREGIEHSGRVTASPTIFTGMSPRAPDGSAAGSTAAC